MLTQISLKNFKVFRDATIHSKRLGIIVGPNGSGKTSFLQALDCCAKLFKSSETAFLANGKFDFLRRGAESLEISLLTDNDELTVIKASSPKSTKIEASINFFNNQSHNAQTINESKKTKEALDGLVFLNLNYEKLSSPSISTEEEPELKPDGSQMASALAHLALNQPDAFLDIQENLRKIIPAVERLRFRRSSLGNGNAENDWGHEVLFDYKQTKGVPAKMVSEGTVFALGIILALRKANNTKLVLIEDLERGLHPRAQRELVAMIRMVMDAHPDIQVFATTHSPYLLDDLKGDEVICTALDDEGFAHCARLDEHPRFGKWAEQMGPGEFWGMMGEKWVSEFHQQGREER